MDGGVCQLTGSLIDAVLLCDDAHVLRLPVGRLHSADVGQLQPAVGLDLCYHRPQGVAVGFQQNGILLISSAQIGQNAAFHRPAGRHSQASQLLQQIIGHLSAVAGRTVNGQQLLGLLHHIIHI